jgi:hypothetical protein
MWSGPRNISTAMMYAWRQRADTEVFDEPLYAAYLARTGRRHPDDALVLAAQDQDGDRVVQRVILGDGPSPVRFYKNMAHHLVGLDEGFLDHVDHVLLTRHPAEMLTSLVQQLPDADLPDTGLPQQVRLLRRLHAAGRPPVVLDARRVLEDPRGQLTACCAALGLPFDPAMLTWPAGPKPEDGVWAPHWYAAVHRSTGFSAPRPPVVGVAPPLEPLLERCMPLYDELLACAARTA